MLAEPADTEEYVCEYTNSSLPTPQLCLLRKSKGNDNQTYHLGLDFQMPWSTNETKVFGLVADSITGSSTK